MSKLDANSFRSILTSVLRLSAPASDADIIAACTDRDLQISRSFRLEAIVAEATELEAAAKIAAQNGMFESGANLRNRAAGLRRALEILTPTPTAHL